MGSFVLLALGLTGSVQGSAGDPALKGRWTSKYDSGAMWGYYPAVHMILTRGTVVDGSSYHSQILWYDSHHPEGYEGGTFFGGVWGWKPDSTTNGSDCTDYPASRFTNLEVGNPSANTFCTGHSALADGRVLISGGTEYGEIGITQSAIFDPSGRTWDDQQPMAQRRWYPTSTTLPNGKVLVSSGSMFIMMSMFGGRDSSDNGSVLPDSLQRLGLTFNGQWESPARTIVAGNSSWPAPRDGHCAALNLEAGSWGLFGGRNANGTLRNDAWLLYRNDDTDSREDYSAVELGAGSGSKPVERYRSAIVCPDTVSNTGAMYVYGGRSASSAFGDVRRLAHPPGSTTWDWSAIATSGAPVARQGHTAVWDPENKKILMFGGADINDQPVGDTLYALTLGATPTWTRIAVDSSLGSPCRPSARHGHLLVYDPTPREVYPHGAPDSNRSHRFILFGGEDANGLKNDVWVLWIPNADTGAHYKWQRIDFSGDEAKPSPRYRLAGDYDPNDRLVIVGGDVNASTSQASDEVWALPLWELTYSPEPWEHIADHPQHPVTGHTVNTVHGELKWARTQEVFDPDENDWTTVAEKSQDWYPFHFVMPTSNDSINVFYAGPDTSSYVLHLSESPIRWEKFPALGTPGFRGGSAVMYRPGKILKVGSRDTDAQGSAAVTTAKKIDLTVSQPAWSTTDTLGAGRVNFNMVILPDGKVLVTGGTGFVRNAANHSPVFTPQIWNPDTGTWTPMTGSSALEADSTIRGYHSNAILLPDGRVLTHSGFSNYGSDTQAGLDSRRATIFCPPYLFKQDGSLADRPVIQACADTVVPGHSFSLAMSDTFAIASACLLRPATSTHAFNQDQRFVPLTIQSRKGMNLVLDGPVNLYTAPPGDYLVFLVDSLGVPSIASWTRVRSDSETGACTDASPAVVSNLSAPDAGRYSILLNWTAPGGNGDCGTAYGYDVRQSTASITEANFYSATPRTHTGYFESAGGAQCMEVMGLNSCSTYYFALKTRDANGIWSKMSNVVSATTQCSGSSIVLCDGGGLLVGGGGEEEDNFNGVTLSSTSSSGGSAGVDTAEDNTLLWRSSQTVEDLVRLGGVAESAGQHIVRVRQSGAWTSEIDRLGLGFVDHSPEVVAVAGVDSVFLGTIAPVASISDSAGQDLSSVLGERNEEPLVGKKGDQLSVQLSSASERTALVIETRKPLVGLGADLHGIVVQRPSPDSSWSTLIEVQPRRGFDRIAIPSGGSPTLRLILCDECLLKSVTQLDGIQVVAPQPLELTGANHSRLGDSVEEIDESGDGTVPLVAGDEMELSFASTSSSPGKVRDFFLSAGGTLTAATEGTAASLASSSAEMQTVWTFSLSAARPNPSLESTLIEFSVAHQVPVTICVYNAVGRLIKTLVRSELMAGPYNIAWDGRDDGGRRVASGVYFYQMNAGGWRSERKLVLLQR
jgi:hypothetical protein